MLQETKELLKGFYGLDDETFKLSEEVMNDIKHKFDEIKEIREYNQYKVLKAMQEANLSDNHFNWTTGYGYNDLGREKVEEIYANVFGAEDALVRPIIVNGTHALTGLQHHLLRFLRSSVLHAGCGHGLSRRDLCLLHRRPGCRFRPR